MRSPRDHNPIVQSRLFACMQAWRPDGVVSHIAKLFLPLQYGKLISPEYLKSLILEAVRILYTHSTVSGFVDTTADVCGVCAPFGNDRLSHYRDNQENALNDSSAPHRNPSKAEPSHRDLYKSVDLSGVAIETDWR